MKTVLRFFFVATLAVFFFSQSFAQTSAKSGSDNVTTGTVVQGKFVDKNNDGVCDNHTTKGSVSQCANFVDKDGNGVCDNTGKENCYRSANGQAQGNRQHNGCGQSSSNCCGKKAGAGAGQRNCCPNKSVNPDTAPAASPDPKK